MDGVNAIVLKALWILKEPSLFKGLLCPKALSVSLAPIKGAAADPSIPSCLHARKEQHILRRKMKD
jgi:hypothetical protein